MNEPIFDPPVPYVGPIQTRFTPGKGIKILGSVPGVAYRFNINLQCGPQTTPQDDIAIQIAVKLLDGYISLNSLQNNIWDEEQRNLTLPIKRAEKFEIILQCDFNRYKITINDLHHYEFPQRIHYDRISHLAIDGDVSIIQISCGSDSLAAPSIVPGYSIEAPKALPIVDTFQNTPSTNTAFTTAASPVPAPYFTYPPPYDAVPSNNSGQFPVQSNYVPYPTSAPYPTAYIPYSTGGSTGIHYPTNSYPPGSVLFNTYPGAPGIPPPPPGATIPLNAASSNFRPVKRNRLKRICAICWSVILIIIGIIVLIFVKILRRGTLHHNRSHRSSSYSDSNNQW